MNHEKSVPCGRLISEIEALMPSGKITTGSKRRLRFSNAIDKIYVTINYEII